MTGKNDLIKELQLAIVVGDQERAKKAAQECLVAGIDPMNRECLAA